MPFTPTEYLPYDFANRRHIGPSPSEMAAMLNVLGCASLDELIDDTLPKSIRQEKPLAFGKPLSERELLHKMRITASKNTVLTSLIGQGYYGTVTPLSSNEISLKIRHGTQRIHLINQKSVKVALRPC